MARLRKTKQVQQNVNVESVNNTKPDTRSQSKVNNVLSKNITKKRGRPRKKSKLVVILNRSAFIEGLIQNLPSDEKMVSNSATQNISKPKIVAPENNQTSTDRLKFIHSFKITAQLSSQSRKIDMIPLPVESVSMKNETSSKKKKLSLPPRKSVKTNVLADIFNVTSSNRIFKSASLEADTSSASSDSPKKCLSRASSLVSLSSISSANRWSSRASISFNNEPHTGHRIIINRCHTSGNNTSPAEEYDRCSREATQVRSESSGYYSEHKLSDNSPISSTLSSPKRHDSVNDSSCLALPSFSSQRSPVNVVNYNTASVTMKRKCDFKTPKLPLSKRPPTRIRTSDYNRLNDKIIIRKDNVKESTQQQNVDDTDDAISLYAESISDIVAASVKCRNVHTLIDNTGLKSNDANPVLHSLNRVENHPNTFDENVNSPVLVAPLTTETLSQNYSAMETHTSKVDQWIASTPPAKDQLNFNAFRNSVKKLCFHHYGRGKCWHEPCRFGHNLPANFQNSLRDLNESQFKLLFSDIVKHTYLFKEAFDNILTYFKEKDSPDDLIYIIENIFKLNLDKTPFIKKVIDTLKDMGFSFVEAVEEILLTHGRKTESLLDILLIFIVEEEDCLENNWHFIDKLTKFRKNKLDYGVVSEIFQKCCNTDNPRKEFCENIYKDLIIKNHIELDKVDRNVVIKYINMLYHFNLTGYAEQLMQYNGIGAHEVNKGNIVPETSAHNVDTVENISDGAKYESDSSSSSSATSSSSSRSSSTSSSDEKESPAKATSTNEAEEALDFSFDNSEATNKLSDEEEQQEEEVYEEESVEESPEYTNIESVEHSCQVVHVDFSVQQKYDYLEDYLNDVNRNTYSSNYYRSEDPVPVQNSSSGTFETVQCGTSPTNERSTPIQESGSTTGQLSPARSTTEADLTDPDILNLMNALNSENMYGILTVMKRSADNNTCRSFVVHTITTLKNMQTPKLCKLIVNIFENLEMLLNSVNQSSNMRSLMKLFAFNVLLVLDKIKEYGTATRVLNIYAKEMDSFLETMCITHFDWLSTKKLRYIFIFKIFVRGRKLKEASKLLKSNLDLFQDMSTDTNANQVEYKKRILNEFIDVALQKDLQVGREAILYLMLNMDSIKNIINLERYLNLLVVKLLNSYSTYKVELLGLLDNIVNGWFKYLKNSVMRGIFVQTFFDLPERKVMEFFNLCVERKIYKIFEGLGNSIDIPKNLVAEEIQYMLHHQFHKICRANFPLENIIISTDQQMEIDEYTSQISVFTNSIVDSEEMIRRIQNVFSRFEHFPTRDKINTDTPGMIVFFYKDAESFFASYRTGLPSITKYR